MTRVPFSIKKIFVLNLWYATECNLNSLFWNPLVLIAYFNSESERNLLVNLGVTLLSLMNIIFITQQKKTTTTTKNTQTKSQWRRSGGYFEPIHIYIFHSFSSVYLVDLLSQLVFFFLSIVYLQKWSSRTGCWIILEWRSEWVLSSK